MKKIKKANIFIYILLFASLAHILYVFPSLPQTIPIHWNFAGQADGFANKGMMFVLYGLAWGVHFLMLLLPKIDPKKDNYKKFQKVYDYFGFLAVLSMIIITELSVIAIIKPEIIAMNIAVPSITAIIFIFMGNYFPKCKHNYFFGIKTPWTLASENVWNKTHRFAGPVWMSIGVVMLIVNIFFTQYEIAGVVGIAGMVIMVILPVGYSYIIFSKEKKDEKVN